jgi:hypothetical protein
MARVTTVPALCPMRAQMTCRQDIIAADAVTGGGLENRRHPTPAAKLRSRPDIQAADPNKEPALL